MQILQSSNAYQLAYETIRNNILNGTLKGGTKLVEEKLASQISVSRTPIREAIRRLEQEGLIREKRVYKPSKSDLLHIFELRMLIDCYAAKVSARSMTKEKLTLLEQAVYDSQTNDYEENVSANIKFHNLIIKECNNPIIYANSEKLNAIIHLFFQTLMKLKRPFIFEEHKEIFNAIAGRNEHLAESLMEKHIKEDLNYILRLKGDF